MEWSTVQTLLLLFGPMIYSRVRYFYNSIRTLPGHRPRPLTPTTRLILNILFFTSLTFLVLTLPPFLPENVITLTSSRLTQTPTDVLFNRLSSHRDPLPTDELLRTRLTSKAGRLLYAHFGPGPLSECTWCTTDDPTTFLYYALPTITFPHLIHIAILGLVTSNGLSLSLFSSGTNTTPATPTNPAGSLWRTQATIAGVGLAIAEIWYTTYADYTTANTTARTTSEIHWNHWKILFYRSLGIALIDGWLGYCIWLTATGRWRGLLPDVEGDIHSFPQHSIEATTKHLEKVLVLTNSTNALKQTVLGDAELRTKMSNFWEREARFKREIEEVEEVKAVRREREQRGDWEIVTKELRGRAEGIFEGLFVERRQRVGEMGENDLNREGEEEFSPQGAH